MMNSLTKQQCNWTDSASPGVPLNPEKDGAHRLRHQVSGLKSDALWSCGGTWLDLSGDFSIPHAAAFYDYLGPCLTPDEAAAIKARAVKWAGIVGTLVAERDQLIGALQIAIERSGDLEPRPAWIDGACNLLNRGFLKVDRAALKDEPFS